MKMHSARFKDPLITQAQPFTILGPVIEESLRFAGVQPEREQVLERFMSGLPRVAVIHGSEDHPPSLGGRDLARRVIRQLWADGVLPVGVSHAIPCEELSQGLPGSHYAFLGRNVCASNIAALMEAHGYDAAFVLGACDKMFIGALRALVEADMARQRRKARPVYAAFIPVSVGREVHVSDRERRPFERIRQKLGEPERSELFTLLDLPIGPGVYEKIKECLDRAFHRRMILENEKDELEGVVARRAASLGANPGSSEMAIVNRLIIAAFGLVPRNMELSLNPLDDAHLAQAVHRLVLGIQKRERRISVSHLVKSNMQNAVTVWNATGGHPSWYLHLAYLAQGLGVRLSPAMLGRKMSKVPCLLSFNAGDGRTAPGLAEEADTGGNSGVDTLMRTLSEKRFIDDRAATLDGSWMHRITEARSANGIFFHSTMTPCSPNSGLSRVHGNVCASGLARVGVAGGAAPYDQKLYLADFYLGREELAAVLAKPNGPLERLRKKVTRDDLYRTWRLNWAGRSRLNGDVRRMAQWEKRRLWEYLVDGDLLRVALFVGGEGPRASGMPQVGFGEANGVLRRCCVLVTDGRGVAGEDGVAIAHVVPEAIEGGLFAAVRAGDWVYLNLKKGELHIVAPARTAVGFRPLSARELNRRGELAKRVHELERRRSAFLPSVRAVLSSVTSAAEGVSPV